LPPQAFGAIMTVQSRRVLSIGEPLTTPAEHARHDIDDKGGAA